VPPPVDKRFSVGRWPNVVKTRWGLELRRVVGTLRVPSSAATAHGVCQLLAACFPLTHWRKSRFSGRRQEIKTGVSDGPNTFWRAGMARGKSTMTANTSETPRASRRVSYPPAVAGERFIP
jgi:hypothetical protein